MKALYYTDFQGPISMKDLSDPECPSDGVVVRVHANGLCRSDWHGWMGHDPDITLPHVPGHELAGEIVEVGSQVRRWKRGQRVTVPFVCGCGHCEQCATGNHQVCENQTQPGFTHWGSFAEYVKLHHADVNLVELPEDMPYTTAAALGCRFVTSFRAVVDQGAVRPGQWVAVHGCGGVGLSAIMIALAVGARVVAVDISEEKLAVARSLGAEVTINALGNAGEGSGSSRTVPEDKAEPAPSAPSSVAAEPAPQAPSEAPQPGSGAVRSDPAPGPEPVPDPAPATPDQRLIAAIRDATGGGAHVSLDALGSAQTAFNSIACLRTRGRHIQVGLTLAEEKAPPIPMDRVIAKELSIFGSHGIQAHRYPELLGMIQAGSLRPQDLITTHLTLSQSAQALMTMGTYAQTGIAVADRMSE